MSDQRKIAVIDAKEARDRAVEKIKKYQQDGAIIYVRPEDLETQGTFYPAPVCVRATEADFHKISGGKLMPKSHHTQLIARATGTSINDVSTRKEGTFTFVGHARGARRMPDGTYLEASAEYEFDAELRAEEDFLKDPAKYGSDVAKRKHVLELARFGRARAETGASLRVIRKLAGIPTAFDRGEIERAMVFARIELNVDRLLENPATRGAAINAALGAKKEIYGPEPGPLAITEAPDITGAVEDGGEFPGGGDEGFETEEDRRKRELREDLKAVLEDADKRDALTAAVNNGRSGYDLVVAVLENDDATEQDLVNMTGRVEQFFAQRSKGGAE